MIERKTKIRVRYAETDQMRFVHHSNYIIWFEFARVELMKHYGFSYARLEDEGYMMPVLEINVQYFKPARFDELITIRAFISQMPRAKIKFEYEVSNEHGVLICRGSSLHSFMNQKDKAVKPPKEFLKEMQKHFK
jgi:acyl-CoA thioester hydrolase